MNATEKKTNERPLHVVYVDDDPDDRFFFKKTLERLELHHTCTTVSNPEMLLDLLESPGNEFDIIFLDINMPKDNGLEFLRKIKKHKKHKDIPVVIFSVSNSRRDIDESYDLGAHYHVVKPHAHINYITTLKEIFNLDWKSKQPVPDKSKFVINHTFSN